jgi:hypothetical protein
VVILFYQAFVALTLNFTLSAKLIVNSNQFKMRASSANFVPLKPVFMISDPLIDWAYLNIKSFGGTKICFLVFLLVLKFDKKVEGRR